MDDVIIIKNRKVNSPHILSSGVVSTTLIGTSDSEYTEQRINDLPVGIRTPRGAIRVLMQIEYKYGDFLEGGKGMVSLHHKMDGNTGFYIFAIHDLPEGISRNVDIHWLAFGYEDYEAQDNLLTVPPVGRDPYLAYTEWFDPGIIDTVVLQRTPIQDSNFMIYSDRIPMFFGKDFAVNGKTVTLNEPLTGVESVLAVYMSKEA